MDIRESFDTIKSFNRTYTGVNEKFWYYSLEFSIISPKSALKEDKIKNQHPCLWTITGDDVWILKFRSKMAEKNGDNNKGCGQSCLVKFIIQIFPNTSQRW